MSARTGDTDLNKLAKVLADMPEDIQRQITTELKAIGEEAAALAQMFVRVDTGALRNTIKSTVEGTQLKLSAGGLSAPHAPIIEVKYPYLAPAVEAIKPQIDALLNSVQMEMQNRVSNTTKQ